MGPKLIGLAAATVALASGHGHDAAPQRGAISRPPHSLTSTPTPTPTPTAGRPGPPRAVRLTIGVSGDLLPHLPIVARAPALAGGRGYDFRPMLRPIRGWVRANSVSFCHIETPLTPAPPVGYPAVQLAARAGARGRGHGVRRVQHGLESLARSRAGRDRRHPAGAGAPRRQIHRLLLLAPPTPAPARVAVARRTSRLAGLHADDQR